jgi:hypothetical protein
MERETRFELATLALARRCSTTELLPLVAVLSIPGGPNAVKPQGTPRGPKRFRLLTRPLRAGAPSPPAQSPHRGHTKSGWQWPPPQDCA